MHERAVQIGVWCGMCLAPYSMWLSRGRKGGKKGTAELRYPLGNLIVRPGKQSVTLHKCMKHRQRSRGETGPVSLCDTSQVTDSNWPNPFGLVMDERVLQLQDSLRDRRAVRFHRGQIKADSEWPKKKAELNLSLQPWHWLLFNSQNNLPFRKVRCYHHTRQQCYRLRKECLSPGFTGKPWFIMEILTTLWEISYKGNLIKELEIL